MAAISQLLRFTLPESPAKTSAFQTLRTLVTERGPVKTQYFGYLIPTESWTGPKEDQVCWYIEWPESATFRSSAEFKNKLKNLAEDCPRSLLFKLKQAKDGEIVKGLESSLCELAIINLTSNAPRSTEEFGRSMDKTFTDCYLAPDGGMTGGGWGYALNSNDSTGEEVRMDDVPERILDEDKRLLAYYFIGWESKKAHHAYSRTELFAEEIDKLKPYFSAGTGAFYVKFQRST